MSRSAPHTPERCRLLLRQWRGQLSLTPREQSLLAGALVGLDRQLERLEQGQLRLAVFGRVGVGKSSLVNALVGEAVCTTDVAHGSTRHQRATTWQQPVPGLQQLELVDTPGIDEIGGAARSRLAQRVARGADLVLLVLDGDLTSVDQDALLPLLASGKPLLLVLNRSDCWPEAERQALEASIRRRLGTLLPGGAAHLELVAVAAAPRRPRLLADGRARTDASAPEVEPLRRHLLALLEQQGELLLALNSLQAADHLQRQLQHDRLRRGRRRDPAAPADWRPRPWP